MVLGVGLSAAIFTTVMAHIPGDQGFFTAIQTSFRFGGIIAAAGMLTSAVRGINFRPEGEKENLRPESLIDE
jgi:hypothetical protein